MLEKMHVAGGRGARHEQPDVVVDDEFIALGRDEGRLARKTPVNKSV